MAIPNNILKEHVEKAIIVINPNKIPSNRIEKHYTLVEDGKILPPKYVISIANKFANGIELDSDDFNAVEARKFLNKYNFTIIDKRMSTPKVWFVAQGTTFTQEKGMKFLWAPKEGKNNTKRFFWDNVLKVKKGDIIFNYSHGIRGISVATSDGYPAKNSDDESIWGKEGYKVDIRILLLDPVITIPKLIENKAELKHLLSSIKNKPFDVRGQVNEGYLYEFTKEAGRLIRDIYGKNFNDNYIDDFFDSTIIGEPLPPNPPHIDRMDFNPNDLYLDILNSGLFFRNNTILRFVCSLLSKPFVILTGLSGSGKTKLAQAFVQWICHDKTQYCIVPVGADWTNREPLLGYPNALNPEEYVKPDNGMLDLIIRANDKQELPFFLILDEMNLSIVERYFADFLSVMESGEAIPLFAEGTLENGVPSKLPFPSNLFIIGTVNIDETTHMFSPKVLDRANTIEFRVTKEEMKDFLGVIGDVNLETLSTKGAGMAESFLQLAKNKTFNSKDSEEINKTLVRFFGELKKTGAEFGYRSAREIIRLINQLSILDDTLSINEKLDIAIMQKLLPKLHGSRRKLCPVLVTLGSFCVDGDLKMEKDVFEKDDFDFNSETVRYPLSLEKIARMHRGAIDNGFASFAEA